jgi:cytidylate kinase
MKRLTIAIDGPSSSGKSTLGKRLARHFGYLFIDTGAMYRAVAWKALQAGVPLDDTGRLEAVARAIRFEVRRSGEEAVLRVDGEDLTARLRTPEVAQGASRVSVVPAVRRVLVQKQQELGREGGVVMDGRDIGTVVFPDAEVKLFVDASAEERARRRWAEDRERGLPSDLPATVREIRERDHRDTTREDSPLRRAPGAIGIDTTGLSIDEVYALVLDYIRRRSPGHVHGTD